MDISPEALASSYAACRLVARGAGSNFYPCFFLLSGELRRGMEALYAFMRQTDDLVDGEVAADDDARVAPIARLSGRRQAREVLDSAPPASCGSAALIGKLSGPPSDDAKIALGDWRAALEGALDGAAGQGEVTLPALADTVARFEIPREYLFDAIDGVEMDLTGRRYETFEELSEYCYRVASVVGLACLRIWGYQGEAAEEAAHRCGMAFQLTNILRDLREDVERGRVYLPQEDLRRFGYAEEDLAAAVADERFDRLMEFQADRVERLYWESVVLADGLAGEGRRMFVMMIRTYYQLLQRIKASPRRVLAERVCLGRWRPAVVMLRTLVWRSGKVLP
jgi:15-cis-phytoene synthase